MIKPLNIPRGIANLFAIGNSSEIPIIQMWEKRPDQILESIGQKSMKKELINNYVSNQSPITMKIGDRYVITDSLFGGYFFNG